MFAVVDLGLAVRLTIEKARGKLPVGAVGNLIQIPGHIFFIENRVFEIIVDGFPVGSSHGGHIESGLHATFDLEAVDAGIDEIRNMADHAEILGVENVGSPLVLIDR